MLKFYYKLLIFSISIFISTNATGQSDKKIDSLEQQLKITKIDKDKIRILGQLGYEYYSIKPLKTLENANKILELSKNSKPDDDVLLAYHLRAISYRMLQKDNDKNEERKANVNKLIALAKKNKSNLYIGRGMYSLGDLYTDMSNEKDAIKAYKEALNYLEKSNDKKDIAIVYSRIARTNILFLNYEEGVKNNLKAIKLFKEVKDTRGETIIMRSLADLYMKMKNFNSAKNMYLKALHISESIDDTSHSSWTAEILAEIGFLYTTVDSLDTAHAYYIKSLNIFKNTFNLRGLPALYDSMGLLFIKKKQYDISLNYFNQALTINRSMNYEFSISENLKNIGHVYLLQKKFNESKVSLDEALDLAIKIKMEDLQVEIYKIISDYYKAIYNFEKSFIFLEKYHALKDTILNETRSKQIAGLQMQYETEQKEKEIKLLNQQSEIQLLTIAKQNSVTQLFVIIFIMLLIILSILFWLFRSKRKANHSLQKKNKEIDNKNLFLENAQQKIKLSLDEKEVLLKEIHHRVKNNLQLVNSLLSIQARDSESRMDVKEFLTKSQDRVQSMALIHETLYMSDNLAKVNFQEYLEKLVNHLLKSFEMDKNDVAIHLETNNIFLDIEKVIPLGLIATELINNALKHAFIQRKGKIEITLLRDFKNDLQLTIYDNGIGLPENYKNKEATLGIELVYDLIKQLEGTLVVDNTNGTSFKVSFPYS